MVDFGEVDRLKGALDGHRPLRPEVARNLREALVLDWTYHSNAIEGNSLSLIETKVVLEGITVGGKSMREHLEAVNHRAAIHLVEDMARQEEPLSEWQIRSIHGVILARIMDEHAGVYRDVEVRISGAKHLPPNPMQVPAEMQRFVAWRNGEAMALHPVERAARVHASFVRIHPFIDGNGRTSRLPMNLELMKSGFPPAVLPVERRLEYYQLLDSGHVEGDYEAFVGFVERIVRDAFTPYWQVLGLDRDGRQPSG